METINFYTLAEVQRLMPKEIDEQYKFTGMKICRHILICGSTGAGKTNAFLNYLKLASSPKNGTFSHVLLCYKTEEYLYEYLQSKLKKDQLSMYKSVSDFPDVDEFTDQTEKKYLIIFDDCVNDKDKQSTNKINRYFTYGRKKGITLLFLSQSFFDTSTFIRKQLGYVLLCGIRGKRDLNLILKDYSIGDIDVKTLNNMYQTAMMKRNADDIPFFKLDCSTCPMTERFSRNFIDYIDPSKF